MAENRGTHTQRSPSLIPAGGVVEAIHTAPAAGKPTVAWQKAHVRPGLGIEGDRYASRQGRWAGPQVSRDLTLVEAEILEALAEEGLALAPGETRRNLTVRGVRLAELVGRRFRVGDVECYGSRLCEPCKYLADLTGKPLLGPLTHKGGLRADVLSPGIVRVGDSVVEMEDLPMGVGVLLMRGGDVLLGLRARAPGAGGWGLPGGKPDPKESVEMCARRELAEETGLDAADWRFGGAIVGHVDGQPWQTVFFVARWESGEPALQEPDRCQRWEWAPWDALPGPLLEPLAELVQSGFDPQVDADSGVM